MLFTLANKCIFIDIHQMLPMETKIGLYICLNTVIEKPASAQ